MNFLVRSYLKNNKKQYIATASAIGISCIFMLCSLFAGNTMTFIMNSKNYVKTQGADLLLLDETLIGQKNKNITVAIPDYLQAKKGRIAEISELQQEDKELLQKHLSNLIADFKHVQDKEAGKNANKPEKRENLYQQIVQKNLLKYLTENYELDKLRPEIIREIPQIKAVYPLYYGVVQADNAKYGTSGMLGAYMTEKTLYNPAIKEGRAPQSENEILLTADTAAHLHCHIGDTVNLKQKKSEKAFQVVGIVPQDAYHRAQGAPLYYVSSAAWRNLFKEDLSNVRTWRIQLQDGANKQQVKLLLQQYLEKNKLLPRNWSLFSAAEFKQAVGGSSQVIKRGLNIALLTFPLLTMFVCYIIITSTFNVILSRRRREIALLRCVGASYRKLVRYSILECLILGLFSSLISVFIAYALSLLLMVKLEIIGSYQHAWNLFGYKAAVITVLTGTLITAWGSLKPAKENNKVPPIAAFNENLLQWQQRKSKTGRLSKFVMFLVAVAATLNFAAAVYFRNSYNAEHKLTQEAAYAVPCLFLGAVLYLIFAVYIGKRYLPLLTAGILQKWGPKSAVVKLAAMNLRRNRERSGATMAALFMGIIMIITTIVGGASLQSTITDSVKKLCPIDVIVQQYNGKENEVKPEVWENLTQVAGVDKSLLLAALPQPDEFIIGERKIEKKEADGKILALPDLGTISRRNFTLKSGEIAVYTPAKNLDGKFSDGQKVQLRYGEQTFEFKLRLINSESSPFMTNLFNISAYISPDAAEMISKKCNVKKQNVMLVAGVKKGLFDSYKLLKEFESLTLNSQMNIQGALVLLSMLNIVLWSMRLILILLISIVSLVALIGVANTLNLAVWSRNRETALLRAVGLDKKSVRQMILLEAYSLSVTSLIVGIIIGLAFAAFGLYVLPLDFGINISYNFVVPPLEVVTVIFLILIFVTLAAYFPVKAATKSDIIKNLGCE